MNLLYIYIYTYKIIEEKLLPISFSITGIKIVKQIAQGATFIGCMRTFIRNTIQFVLINVVVAWQYAQCEGYSWPHLNIVLIDQNSSWPTLMGRERKRRTITEDRHRIEYLYYNLCLYICSNVHQFSVKTDVCIKLGKHHTLTYPEKFVKGYKLVILRL